jgi:hypothetical protein
MEVRVQLSPEVERAIEDAVRREVRRQLTGSREDWSPEKMRAAMDRIVERRKQVAFPPDELEAMLEEHRKEIGRGPLVEERDERING